MKREKSSATKNLSNVAVDENKLKLKSCGYTRYIVIYAFLIVMTDTTVAAHFVSEKTVNDFSQNFGQNIYELNSKMSALQDLRIDYILMGAKFNAVNGNELTGRIRKSMENLVNRKKESLKSLKHSIHQFSQEHIFDDTLKMTYPDSKVIASEFELRESARFNGMMINLSMSTVHIPDKVFEKC